MSEQMIAEQSIGYEIPEATLSDMIDRYCQRGRYAPKPKPERVSVFLRTPTDFYEEMVRAQNVSWLQLKGY